MVLFSGKFLGSWLVWPPRLLTGDITMKKIVLNATVSIPIIELIILRSLIIVPPRSLCWCCLRWAHTRDLETQRVRCLTDHLALLCIAQFSLMETKLKRDGRHGAHGAGSIASRSPRNGIVGAAQYSNVCGVRSERCSALVQNAKILLGDFSFPDPSE